MSLMSRLRHIGPSIAAASVFFAARVALAATALERLGRILNNLINWALGALIAISVAFVIYAAFLYLTGADNEENIKKARKILIYVAVAVAVGLLSKGFVDLIVWLVRSREVI